MSARELVVLGTASQVPTRTRNHNGYLLRWDGAGFLFDPGEGTQRQLTYAGVPASAIDTICITHAHGDHCLGLPGVVQRRALDGARTPVDLYYPAAAADTIDALLVLCGPAAATVRRHPVSGSGLVVDVGAWWLSAAELDHRVPALGWRVQEPDGRRVLPDVAAALGVRGPLVGRLLAEGSVVVEGRTVVASQVTVARRGQSFAFVMDTRPCASAVELARQADIFVCESTFLSPDEALAHEFAHCTAGQAAAMAVEAGAHELLLTHFSQRYGDDVEVFAAEARAVAGDRVHVQALRDLDRVSLPKRR